DGLRLEQLHAIAAAAVQQHLEEGQIVARRRVQRATSRPELRLGRHGLEGLRREASVGLPRVEMRLAGTLLGCGLVPAVFHAARSKDVVAEGHVERLSAGGFDKTANPVGVYAVAPGIAGAQYPRHPGR